MPDVELPTVLVLDQVAQTLPVIRSLGRAGYPVILGRAHRRTEAERSRFCTEIWAHPDVNEQDAFGSALLELLESRPDIGIIFPVGETSGNALCAIPGLFGRDFGRDIGRDVQCVMPSPDLFIRCRDKRCANALAEQAGLAIPATRTVASLPELEVAAREIGYPLIVKPFHSTAPLLGRKALIVRTPGELVKTLPAWPTDHADLLVQTCITGPLEQCDFVACRGELVSYFECRSVRTDALDGTGYGLEFESQAVTPDLLAACTAFAAAHDYSGPGLLQFIRSDRDGKLYFIENNPRLSAGIDQAIACGLDAPLIALLATRAGTQPAADTPASGVSDPSVAAREPGVSGMPAACTYRIGDRSHWLSRDIEAWLRNRRTLTPRQQRRWLRAIWQAWRRADRQMNACRHDPVPALWLYGRLARRCLRALVLPLGTAGSERAHTQSIVHLPSA